MHVQVEGPAKPLDHRDAAASACFDAFVLRASPQHALHRAQQDTHDRPAEIVVPRQLVAHAVGHAQNPLSHGHVWNT